MGSRTLRFRKDSKARSISVISVIFCIVAAKESGNVDHPLFIISKVLSLGSMVDRKIFMQYSSVEPNWTIIKSPNEITIIRQQSYPLWFPHVDVLNCQTNVETNLTGSDWNRRI
jgi:hypothetical protein